MQNCRPDPNPTNSDPNPTNSYYDEAAVPAELDPAGANVGLSSPYVGGNPPSNPEDSLTTYPSFSSPAHPSLAYTMDGIRIPLDTFMLELGHYGKDPLALLDLVRHPTVFVERNLVNTHAIGNFNGLLSLLPPQNTGDLKDLSSLIAGARNVIANASGDCAKLLGKDALAKFDAIAGNIQFNGNIGVHVEGLGGGIQEGLLSEVPGIDAVTDVPNKQVYLNPNGRGFNTYTRAGQSFHPLQTTFDKFGVTQTQYAFSVLIHEFLHTTGRFKPDSTIGLDGKINSSKSREYQEKLLKSCFSQKKK